MLDQEYLSQRSHILEELTAGKYQQSFSRKNAPDVIKKLRLYLERDESKNAVLQRFLLQAFSEAGADVATLLYIVLPREQQAYIVDKDVDPEYQRHGVSTTLFSLALLHLEAETEVKSIYAHVSNENPYKDASILSQQNAMHVITGLPYRSQVEKILGGKIFKVTTYLHA
jgi:ribosomal protein S18 acetylase RimI-like enzyme